jgi:hypothetical protein
MLTLVLFLLTVTAGYVANGNADSAQVEGVKSGALMIEGRELLKPKCLLHFKADCLSCIYLMT